jgi:uncharacterized protein involved in exopolysaccharide biosynthesis
MELKRYWEIVCRRKWLLIIAAALTPLAAYLLMKVMPPIYKSEAKFWVRINTLQQKYATDVPDVVGRFDFTTSDNAMGIMEEVLKSSSSVDRVIKDMHLTNKKGELFTADKFMNPYKIKFLLHLQNKGVIEDVITDSEVIKVTGYSTDSPSEANEISRRIVSEFIDTFSGMYKDAASKARKTIEARLMDVTRRLQEAQNKLALYRTTNKVYNIGTETSTFISDISALESTRYQSQRSLEEAKKTIDNIREASLVDPKNGIKDTQVSIENTSIMEDYKKQLLTYETSLASVSIEETEEHPDVKALKQQIETVKDKIRKEVAKNFASQLTGRDSLYDMLASTYANSIISVVDLTVRTKMLEGQIKEKKSALGTIPDKERKLNDLQWDVDNLKTDHDALLKNLETTKTAEMMDLANAFVFQSPTLYENRKDNQYFPPTSTKMVMAIAVCVGIFVGFFLIFLVEYWNLDEKAEKVSGKDDSAGQY